MEPRQSPRSDSEDSDITLALGDGVAVLQPQPPIAEEII